MFIVLDESYDDVICSVNLTAKADYQFAMDHLVPLIDRLEFQRSPLRKSFYSRLERDIVSGCIMPFLTIAIKAEGINLDYFKHPSSDELIRLFDNAFVLDGIQRLNTLSRVAQNEKLDLARPVFFNILICNSMDRLLYRMVTLNNGQKPMSARHQIEVLASNIFDFEDIPIEAITEKQVKTKKRNSVSDQTSTSKDTLIKSYIAYISNSINIDNQRIIEEKMDELITDQIMDSNITIRKTEFSDVMAYVKKCMEIPYLKDWFSVTNNLIGFSAAMSSAFCDIQNISMDDLKTSISIFEDAFASIDVSKIKLGLARRRMVKYFFEKFEKLSDLTVNQLLDKISMEL